MYPRPPLPLLADFAEFFFQAFALEQFLAPVFLGLALEPAVVVEPLGGEVAIESDLPLLLSFRRNRSDLWHTPNSDY